MKWACFCSCTSVKALPRCGKAWWLLFGVTSEAENFERKRVLFPKNRFFEKTRSQSGIKVLQGKCTYNYTSPSQVAGSRLNISDRGHIWTPWIVPVFQARVLWKWFLELWVIAKPVTTPSRFPYTESFNVIMTWKWWERFGKRFQTTPSKFKIFKPNEKILSFNQAKDQDQKPRSNYGPSDCGPSQQTESLVEGKLTMLQGTNLRW